MISRRALLTSTAIPVLAGFAPTGLLLSGAPSAPSAPPSLDLSFGGPTLDPWLTFTRGSTATYFDATGTMQTVSGNAPRFDYDPVTHALNGLLIEEARTNSIRNSSTAGAVIGTATLPTNWAILNAGGLTATVVGLGTDANGLQYIDIQLVGTTGGAWRIAFETNAAIAAVQNQVWTSSVYVALVAGSTTGLTVLGTGFMAYTSGGTLIAAHEIVNIQPTNAPLVSQRVRGTTTATDATTGFVRQTYAGTVAAVSVNATLRFAFPQLELGAFPTSYIPTTGAAVTRATDVLTIQPANMSPWFNAGPGSWMIAATSYPPVGGPRRLINHLSTTAVYPLWQQTSNNLFSFDGVGNLATVATIIPGVPFSGASTWNTGGAATICLNGGAVNSNSLQTTGFASLLTTGVKFFADPPGTSQNTGYIRRVRYWPRVLSNTELQQVTA